MRGGNHNPNTKQSLKREVGGAEKARKRRRLELQTNKDAETAANFFKKLQTEKLGTLKMNKNEVDEWLKIKLFQIIVIVCYYCLHYKSCFEAIYGFV